MFWAKQLPKRVYFGVVSVIWTINMGAYVFFLLCKIT